MTVIGTNHPYYCFLLSFFIDKDGDSLKTTIAKKNLQGNSNLLQHMYLSYPCSDYFIIYELEPHCPQHFEIT